MSETEATEKDEAIRETVADFYGFKFKPRDARPGGYIGRSEWARVQTEFGAGAVTRGGDPDSESCRGKRDGR